MVDYQRILRAARDTDSSYLVVEWQERVMRVVRGRRRGDVVLGDITSLEPDGSTEEGFHAHTNTNRYKTLRGARRGDPHIKRVMSEAQWKERLAHRLILRWDPTLLPVVLDGDNAILASDDRAGGEIEFAERQVDLWAERVRVLRRQEQGLPEDG